MDSAIVWFRRDLRLADNPALTEALKHHRQVIPLYIHAPQEEGEWKPGEASRWWLHNSLKRLDGDLRDRGGALNLCSGSSAETLDRVLAETGAGAVYCNRLYDPALMRRDQELLGQLQKRGVDCHSFGGHLLREPSSLLNKQGKPYRVFTAYWRACSSGPVTEEAPLPSPGKLQTTKRWDFGENLDDLGLLPKVAWYNGLDQHWSPGEAGASEALDGFLAQAVDYYAVERDRPDITGTSRLSPHLHFGEITPRQILWSLQVASQGFDDDHRLQYRAQLGWRDFAHYILYHYPHTSDQSMDSRFDQMSWAKGAEAAAWLKRWQRGETGVPIVDAGMRELWHTGWMHNRVRMIVASFLTKNLGIHWREGARWFWDTLVDADLANNSMGWQWCAGSGVDAAPYFRIFNPYRQQERFDPDGDYLRRWLSADELAKMEPMVDVARTRKAALDRWDEIRHLKRSAL